ncbi:MAG: signal peptidase II [Chloroflexi bacterium]|nr:signal peptidase II [Chloroflexota bacterium]
MIESHTHLIARVRRGALFLAVALLIVLLDQVTKSAIRLTLAPGESLPADAPIRLTHVINTGAAFGLFTGQSAFLLLATAVGVGAILLYYAFPPANSRLLDTALGLQFGGALGNLIDRVRQGYVTDFIDLRVWPVFNLADSAIVVGVAVLAGFLMLSQRAASHQET